MEYDPASGIFTYRAGYNPRFTGKRAGAVVLVGKQKIPYRVVCIDGFATRASRVAWLYMTGEWPENDIDHKNHDATDDRWANLRHATRSQNLANRRKARMKRVGLRGVYPTRSGKFVASINHGRTIYLGTFLTAEEAHSAYVSAAKKMFGDFAHPENCQPAIGGI